MFLGLLILAFAIANSDGQRMFMQSLASDPCDSKFYDQSCDCKLEKEIDDYDDNFEKCDDYKCSSEDNSKANEECKAKGFKSGHCQRSTYTDSCKQTICPTTKKEILSGEVQSQTCECKGDFSDRQNEEAMQNYAKAIYEVQVKVRSTSCRPK